MLHQWTAKRSNNACTLKLMHEGPGDRMLLYVSSSGGGGGQRQFGPKHRDTLIVALNQILEKCRIVPIWSYNDPHKDISVALQSESADSVFRTGQISYLRRRGKKNIGNHALFVAIAYTAETAQALQGALGDQLGPILNASEDTKTWDVTSTASGKWHAGVWKQFLGLVGKHNECTTVPCPDTTVPSQAGATWPEGAFNCILEGVPGTGKSHAIAELARQVGAEVITIIVMHPNIGYEDMMEGVRPAAGGWATGAVVQHEAGRTRFDQCYAQERGDEEEGAGFAVRGGEFLLACAKACQKPRQRFMVVLDEINRCNLPRALGELLLSLEASKRWRYRDGDWTGEAGPKLPLSGLCFFVPDNLFILGTMNSADRSVAPLDAALRRRFDIVRREPMEASKLQEQLRRGLEGDDANLVDLAITIWDSLNSALLAHFGPDAMLGHSYFFDARRRIDANVPARAAFATALRNSVLPQVFEVLHGSGVTTFSTFRDDKVAKALAAFKIEIEEPAGKGSYSVWRVRTQLTVGGPDRVA